MFFEVRIPPSPSSSYESAFHVEAKNWRSALRAGLTQTDGEAPSLDGFFTSISEGLVVVTDPVGRRRIHIRSVDPAETNQSQLIQALTGAHRAVTPPEERTPSGASARPVGFTDRSTGRFRRIDSVQIDAQEATSAVEESGRILAHTVQPKAQTPSASETADAVAEPSAVEGSVSETALEDVFLEIQTIFEPGYEMEDAIDFVVGLAKRYIPSATVGVLFASDDADHLYFAAVEGEGAEKLLEAEIDIRKGLPAVSLKGGVSIAVADPAQDRRHTDQLQGAGAPELQSICVAPVQDSARAFGVLVLCNRQERAFYSQYDANILSYIGSQMGRYIRELLDSGPLE